MEEATHADPGGRPLRLTKEEEEDDIDTSPDVILSMFTGKISRLQKQQQQQSLIVYSNEKFKEIKDYMIRLGKLTDMPDDNTAIALAPLSENLQKYNENNNNGESNEGPIMVACANAGAGAGAGAELLRSLKFYPVLVEEARKVYLEVLQISSPGGQATVAVISSSTGAGAGAGECGGGGGDAANVIENGNLNLSRISKGHIYRLFPEVSLISPSSLIKSYSLTVGRSLQSHICVPDILVSKNHAIISFYEGYGFYIKDVGSKHGTYVDDIELSRDGNDSFSSFSSSTQAHNNDSNNDVLMIENRATDSKQPLEEGEVVDEVQNESSSSTRRSNKTVEYCYLYDGAILTLGRVKLKFSIERQSAVLSRGFEPSTCISASSGVPSQATSTCTAQNSSIAHSLRGGESEVKRHQMIVSGAYSRELLSIERSHRDDAIQKKITCKRKLQDAGLVFNDNTINSENTNIFAIKPSGVGQILLSKHGWGAKSRALGKNEQGIAEPLKVTSTARSQGLGYANPGSSSRTNIEVSCTSIYRNRNSNSNSDSNSYPKGGFAFGDFVYNPPLDDRS